MLTPFDQSSAVFCSAFILFYIFWCCMHACDGLLQRSFLFGKNTKWHTCKHNCLLRAWWEGTLQCCVAQQLIADDCNQPQFRFFHWMRLACFGDANAQFHCLTRKESHWKQCDPNDLLIYSSIDQCANIWVFSLRSSLKVICIVGRSNLDIFIMILPGVFKKIVHGIVFRYLVYKYNSSSLHVGPGSCFNNTSLACSTVSEI